jgi:hypothetical protein
LQGFVNILSVTRNLEVKYCDSGGFEGSEGSEGSEARGVQLKGKAEAEAEVPQGIPEGRMVEFQKVEFQKVGWYSIGSQG